MRVLVTGADGFVGTQLVSALQECGDEVFPARGPHAADDGLRIDLSKVESLHNAVETSKPDAIFHLAGQAFVPRAMDNPIETYQVNAMGTIRLLEAVRSFSSDRTELPRFIFASSAAVYGKVDESRNPVQEDYLVYPVEPYGASKAAAEYGCIEAWHSYGLPVVIARSFNHIGPHQSVQFAAPSFADQLARIKCGLGEPFVSVGNLSPERDFLDVRDVVRAYITLSQHGIPGEVYNVCCGTPTPIAAILRMLIDISGLDVKVVEDPAKFRPVEIRVSYGDNARLRALGWQPEIPLEQTLREIYEYALERNCELAKK